MQTTSSIGSFVGYYQNHPRAREHVVCSLFCNNHKVEESSLIKEHVNSAIKMLGVGAEP
jgi:hypothetical protein